MLRGARCATLLVLALGIGIAIPKFLSAQEKPVTKPGEAKPGEAKTPDQPSKADANTADRLAMDQQQVADRFKHLEEVLLRMAELNGPSDPRRAALLRKAVAQSKDKLIGVQFDAIVEFLKKDQLSPATENQGELDRDLRALLELLLSENRAERNKSERARIRDYLKQIVEILNQHKSIQARTAGDGDPNALAGEQGRLAGKTGDLARKIKENEEGSAKPSDKNDVQGKPGEGKQGKPGEGKPGKGKPGEGKPGAGKQGKQGDGQSKQGPGQEKQGEGQGKQGSQGQGQGQGQDQQNENPARKRLEEAQKRMQEAEQNLKKAEKEGAKDKQEQARQKLEEAKAELEKILRQLREEEQERVLAMLEARFTKMLQMQKVVYEGTIRLDKVPLPERTHSHEIESSRLSSKEAEIDMEAEKAISLLKDDGTAVAFPEAVGQMRQDIQQIVQRLGEIKVEKITQGLEEDVMTALEEMIKALQKAQKDLEKKKGNPPPGQSQQQDPPLVDELAELKMIRSLQMRVNTRTDRYSKLLGDKEQAIHPDLVEALKRLGEREERIFKITRDLEMGKNR